MSWSRDTRVEAHQRLVELTRQIPPERRLAILDGEFATSRLLVLSGIRRRTPGASEEIVEARYYRLVLGSALGERVLALRRARRSAEAGG